MWSLDLWLALGLDLLAFRPAQIRSGGFDDGQDLRYLALIWHYKF